MTGRRSNFWRWRGSSGVKTASQSLQQDISTYNSEGGSRLHSTGNSGANTLRPKTGMSTARPSTARPRTGISTANSQDIICAISESRGVTPVVGMALLNLNTCEVFLCQINDNPQYVRTIQKLSVFEPQVVIVSSYGGNPSKLHLTIEETMADVCRLEPVDRQYFTEVAGHELLQQLAFAEDFEALRASLSTTFFAVCCFAAVSISTSQLPC
jgi:DNA mismatch repair protein MSH4